MALTEEERKARHRERKRQWREANPERARERQRQWREANPERNRERNRERQRQWREANPERAREQARQWREANPERAREQRRQWREANPERVREQRRQWREANPERAREQCRQWREANPERARNLLRQSRHIRRAHKANAIDVCAPQVTTAAIDRRFWLFGNACAYCGADSLLHLDHLDPLARGGLHVPQNLVPACERCNLSKGAKPVEAWYLSQPFFSPERWEALQLHTARRWTAAKQLSLLDHF
jgi:hypothetical protein